MWQSTVVKSTTYLRYWRHNSKNTIVFPEGQELLLHVVWLGLKAHEEKCSRGSQIELN